MNGFAVLRLLPLILISQCLYASSARDLCEKTLGYYDTHATQYVTNTQNLDVSNVLDSFLGLVPKGGLILDAGAGSGRDSLYFLNKGFKVAPIDGSAELAKLASIKIGQPVRVTRFQDVKEIESYDGIFAMASLIHIPLEELPQVLSRFSKALKPGGVFFSSWIQGTETKNFTDEAGRTFNSVTPDDLRGMLEKTSDLEVKEIKSVEVVWSDGRKSYSIQAICQKAIR